MLLLRRAHRAASSLSRRASTTVPPLCRRAEVSAAAVQWQPPHAQAPSALCTAGSHCAASARAALSTSAASSYSSSRRSPGRVPPPPLTARRSPQGPGQGQGQQQQQRQRDRRAAQGARALTPAEREALLNATNDPSVAHAASMAPHRASAAEVSPAATTTTTAAATSADTSAPGAAAASSSSLAAVARSLVCASPLLELRYRTPDGKQLFVAVLRQLRSQQHPPTTSPSSAAADLAVLAVARGAAGPAGPQQSGTDDVQQRAWRQALESLRAQQPTPAGVGAFAASSEPVTLAALLSAGGSVLPDSSAFDRRPAALHKAWTEHSQAVLRPFLRSFVAYAHRIAADPDADAPLPPLHLRTEEEFERDEQQHAASAAAVSSSTASPFVPLLRASGWASSFSLSSSSSSLPSSPSSLLSSTISAEALGRRLARSPLVRLFPSPSSSHSLSSSAAAATTESAAQQQRWSHLRTVALKHMLADLLPDPTLTSDPSARAERLEMRRQYARARGWPSSVADDPPAFEASFLAPRRIHLRLSVSADGLVDAHEVDLFARGLRPMPDSAGRLFVEAASKSPISSARAERRRVAENLLADLHQRRAHFSQRDLYALHSPAPFASWAAVHEALSPVASNYGAPSSSSAAHHGPLSLPQCASLSYTLGRDAAVLHSLPFLSPLDAISGVKARRQLYARWHAMVRQRLEQQRQAQARSAHRSIEQQVADLANHDRNEKFLAQFGAAGPATAAASTSAAAVGQTPSSKEEEETVSLPSLLRELDSDEVVSLHDALLSSLSRSLDVPSVVVRHALEEEDMFVRAEYVAEARRIAASGELGLAAATAVAAMDDEQLLPPAAAAAEAEQSDAEEQQLRATEGEQELEQQELERAEEEEEAEFDPDLEEGMDAEEQEGDADEAKQEDAEASSSLPPRPLGPGAPKLSQAGLAALHAQTHAAMMMSSSNPSYRRGEGLLHSVYPLVTRSPQWLQQRKQIQLLRQDCRQALYIMRDALRGHSSSSSASGGIDGASDAASVQSEMTQQQQHASVSAPGAVAPAASSNGLSAPSSTSPSAAMASSAPSSAFESSQVAAPAVADSSISDAPNSATIEGSATAAARPRAPETDSSSSASSASLSSPPQAPATFYPPSFEAPPFLSATSSGGGHSSATTRRVRHMADRSALFAANIAEVLSRCLSDDANATIAGAGGVRVATERWLRDHSARLSMGSTPDLLVLDDVSIEVVYPSTLPGSDSSRSGDAATLAQELSEPTPLRWIEAKSVFGAFVQYESEQQQQQQPQQGSQSDSSRTVVWPSPSVAQLVEQCARYRALLGPGCVVFEKGLSDAWVRASSSSSTASTATAGCSSANASTAANRVSAASLVPDGVRFVDAAALTYITDAHEKK